MALHPAVARTVPFRRRSASLGHPSPESRGPRHRLEPVGRPSGRTSGRRLVAVVTLTALALTGVGVGAAAAAAPKHLGLSAPKHLSLLLLSAPKHLAKAPKHLGRAPKHLSRAPKHLATAPKHLSAQTVGTATVAFTTSAKHGGKASGKVKGTGKGAGTVMGDRAGDRHGPKARGDGAGRTVAAFWPWRGVLHGRFTVMSKERSAPAAPQLVTVQRGEVTAVDGATRPAATTGSRSAVAAALPETQETSGPGPLVSVEAPSTMVV